MIIEKNISKFTIYEEDSLSHALEKISENKKGVVFSLTDSGKLEGVLTDGDFRRWLVDSSEIDLSIPVNVVTNKDFVSLPADTDRSEIKLYLNDRVKFLPLLDNFGHLVSIAQGQADEFKIGDFVISPGASTFVIAEIGNNHNGSLDLAKKLVDKAVEAGADCAKFQMRSMDKLYGKSGRTTDISEDLGAQYTLDLLSRFQLCNDDLFEVFDHCKSSDILPLCTPWDHDSLDLLDGYGMQAFKLASADLINHDLIESMTSMGKPIISSTGMSSESEIVAAVKLFKKSNCKHILLHCNSTYPAPFKDINLRYLDRLRKIGDCPVGYSGHERGAAICIAAVAMGACVIEKHFTLDREMEGNDHRVSLLPSEFISMIKGIREVEEGLGSHSIRHVTQGEMMNREILSKSLAVNKEIKTGTVICSDMIEVRSPGKGLPPYYKTELVGKTTTRDLKAGDFFFFSDLHETTAYSREYEFPVPFGIPVRFHDVEDLRQKSNFDLFEFHLSYKDLEEDPEQYFSMPMECDLVVHSPELFAGDHVMDLSSGNSKYRERSVYELQRVAEMTRKLKRHFPNSSKTLIIVNVGGFSLNEFLPESELPALYDQVGDSLNQINQDGIEFLPQTMPPYPWHFGGQRFHNLFLMPDEISRFHEMYGYRVCLDISHSYLACNHFGISFHKFLEEVAPLSAHHHIVDAEGIDGEGLQIGEGKIDFDMTIEILLQKSPQASFIPEIWQGHKNDGEGFWLALERLENSYKKAEVLAR